MAGGAAINGCGMNNEHEHRARLFLQPACGVGDLIDWSYAQPELQQTAVIPSVLPFEMIAFGWLTQASFDGLRCPFFRRALASVANGCCSVFPSATSCLSKTAERGTASWESDVSRHGAVTRERKRTYINPTARIHHLCTSLAASE